MKIGVDATSLLLRSAGVKNYIHYWTASLIEAARRSGDLVRTYPPGLSPSAVLNHESALTGSLRARLQLACVVVANQRRNPALSWWARRFDVFHCSQHIAERPRGATITATIYDFSCWTTPGMHTPENVAATSQYAEKILKSSDGLIAISEHTRREAVAILGIPTERIRAIYPGVADAFFNVTAADADRVRRKYGLPERFILFVGCVEPRKNVPRLLTAHSNLPAAVRRDAPLVIAGPFGWENDSLRKLLGAPPPGIRYLGYIPEPDLPGLVRAASAFAYPSHNEGFGLPLAQAMACGVPVVTSNRSCLPEVAGDAGLLVDPDCADELTHALEELLDSPGLAERLGARGKARAERFRWAVSAEQSLAFFREVTGAPSRPSH